MSVQDDDGLDGRARALLGAFREREELPDDVRARVWRRLDHERPRWTGRAAVVVLAAAAAIALVVLGRGVLEPREEKPANEQAPYVERAEPVSETAAVHEQAPRPRAGAAESAPAQTPAPLEAAGVDAGTEPPALERKPVKPRAPAPSVTPAEPQDPLAAEAELLRRARAALSRGEARAALALLDEATRRFEDGVLGEERDALRVLALCDAGERAKARTRADEFERAHPGSPLAGRVRDACAEP